MTDDDVEYCAKCGYSEFNDDGTESHADEKEYDHDFEYEEEDEGTTLEDVNNFLDTANKGLDFYNKLKKQTQPTQPETTPENVIAHLEVGRMSEEYRRKEPAKQEDLKLKNQSDAKIEKRHKETMKWTKIGIGVGAIVAVILGIVAIIFN